MLEKLSKVGEVSVRTTLAVTSSGEETNQRSEVSAEFCAKAGREGFAKRSKVSIPLASVFEGRLLQLALGSSAFVSRSLLILVLQNDSEV